MSQTPDQPTAPVNPPLRDWLRDRRVVVTLVAIVVLLAAIPFGIGWLVYRFTHSITNDAFVEAHLVNLAPQVPGHIAQILVQEHDTVEKGQLLALIDPRPYERQVELSQSKLAVAQAEERAAETTLQRLRDEVPRRIAIAEKEEAVARDEEGKAEKFLELTRHDVDKSIEAAGASVEGARAVLVRATEDFKRYSKLYEEKSVPERRLEEATKDYKTARAELTVAETKLSQAEAAKRQIDIAERSRNATSRQIEKASKSVELAKLGSLQIEEADRQLKVKARLVEEAHSALAVAQTNLAYTRIVAPFPGTVVKRYRHLGDFVPVSASILTIYNPELTYVTAHMEETRLTGIAPGNEARLDIDAFRQPFRGRVVWINKATGANFALVPRDITSGEFTRIVQRVPIRIAIEKDERWPQLRPGLSVTVSIAHGPGDPEWARQAADEQRQLESGIRD